MCACACVPVYVYTHRGIYKTRKIYTQRTQWIVGDVYVVLRDSLNRPTIIHIHIFITENKRTNLSKLCYARMVSSVL